MFVAKIKTTMMVLCGVAALGLGTGGVLYQTRAGAADDPKAGQKKAAEPDTKKDLNFLGRKKAAEKDTLLALNEELRVQEQRLREELQKAREEVLEQRDRAEAERRRAETEIAELKSMVEKARRAELEAKKKAEQILYTANLQQAQREGKKQTAPEPRPQPQNEAERTLRDQQARMRVAYELRRLDVQQQIQKLRQEYEEQIKALEVRLAALQVQHEKGMMDLEQEVSDRNERQKTAQPKQPRNAEQPSGDKLDRILDRLEHIERRLERLERGKGLNERRE